MRKKDILVIIGGLVLLIFIVLIAFLILPKTLENITVITDKTGYRGGEALKVKIDNNLKETISFSSCYPYSLERKNEHWESYKYGECQDFNGNEHYITAGEEKAFEITVPRVSDGLHRLSIPVCIDCKDKDSFQEDKRLYSNEFTIK